MSLISWSLSDFSQPDFHHAPLTHIYMSRIYISRGRIFKHTILKVHTTLGTEFGENKGKTAIIVRALYGLASSAASFRNHLVDCMSHLGYKSCLEDPDCWYKPDVREEDKFKYYSYVLLYVGDCICIHHSAEEELNKIDKFFKMKAGSLWDQDIYLGAKAKPMNMNNGNSMGHQPKQICK